MNEEKIETIKKSVVIEKSSLNETQGTFEGFATTYDKDDEEDQFKKGAFDEALSTDRGSNVPVFTFHDSKNWVGAGVLEKVDNGVKIKGSLFMDTVKGRECYSILKKNAYSYLSIGARVHEHEDLPGGRYLINKATIVEVSVVPIPANRNASIYSVKSMLEPSPDYTRIIKSLDSVRGIENFLRDAGGLSSKQSKTFISVFKQILKPTVLKELDQEKTQKLFNEQINEFLENAKLN